MSPRRSASSSTSAYRSPLPDERLARIVRTSRLRALPELRHLPPRMVASLVRRESVSARTFANPRLRSPADLDRREYRRLEFPAAGGIGTVRGIARAYAELAGAGRALGLSADTLAELRRPAQPPPLGWRDAVLKVDTAYSLGFVKPSPQFRFGSSDRAFGHPGAGGSFAFADPDRAQAFAYAPNRLGFHLSDDPREKALRDALYACLDSGGEAPERSDARCGRASRPAAPGLAQPSPGAR
jgi:CubicO group peptidase (beta-lactamase class C family)